MLERLALTSLETRVTLIDDINAAFAAHNTTILVPLLSGFE